MEAIPNIGLVPLIVAVIGLWAPLLVAVIAIFGWTYKLNRDLRADLQKEMAENKREILNHFQSHVHESRSGEVLLRALANQ